MWWGVYGCRAEASVKASPWYSCSMWIARLRIRLASPWYIFACDSNRLSYGWIADQCSPFYCEWLPQVPLLYTLITSLYLSFRVNTKSLWNWAALPHLPKHVKHMMQKYAFKQTSTHKIYSHRAPFLSVWCQGHTLVAITVITWPTNLGCCQSVILVCRHGLWKGTLSKML